MEPIAVSLFIVVVAIGKRACGVCRSWLVLDDLPVCLKSVRDIGNFAQATASSMKQPRRHRACNVQSDGCIASLNFSR